MQRTLQIAGFTAALFFLFSSLFIFALPVTPEDVMTDPEITSVITSGNFFDYDQMDETTPIWRQTKRKYQQHFLRERTKMYGLEQILHHVFTDGFPLQYSLQDLVRAKLGVHVAVGKILPSINVNFGQGLSLGTVIGAFSGLFSFLRPDAWLNLAAKTRANKVAAYTLQKTLLDQLLAAKMAYYNQLQLISDLEIISYYLIHVQILGRKYTNDDRFEATLTGYFSSLGADMATRRAATKLGFDDLASVMALEKLGNDATVRSLNIKDAEDFPDVVMEPSLQEWPYNNRTDFVKEVVARSVELKTVNELAEIAKLNIGIAAVGGTFSTVDNNAGHLQDNFHLGYDTIPTILIAKSQSDTSQIQVREQYLKMLDAARRSYDMWTNAYGAYVEASRDIRQNRKALREHISYLNGNPDAKPDALLFQSVRQLISSELAINSTLHNSLRAKALLDRYLVTENEHVERYLPSNDEISAIFEELKIDKRRESKSEVLFGEIFRELKTTEQLTAILYHYDQDPRLVNFSKEMIIKAVGDNMPKILYTDYKQRKSARYFRTLKRFVEENHVVLSNSDVVLLNTKLSFSSAEINNPPIWEVKENLGVHFAENATILSGIELSAEMQQALTAFKEEIEVCGFYAEGSACIDSAFTQQSENFVFNYLRDLDEYITVSPMRYVDGQKSATFALMIVVDHASSSQPHLRSAIVYSLTDPNTKPKEVLAKISNASVAKVMEVGKTIQEGDAISILVQRLQTQPQDVRSLYHQVAKVASLDIQRKTISQLNDILRSNYELLIKKSAPIYQQKFLSLIQEYFSCPNDFFLKIAQDQLLNADMNVAQDAAIILAKKKIGGSLIKEKIRDALKNPNYLVRERAVEGLSILWSKDALSKEEITRDRALLIGMTLDDEESVRRNAQIAVGRLSLGNDDLTALEGMLQSILWTDRLYAFKLISGIRTPEGKAKLLIGLTDSEDNIRAYVAGRVKLVGIEAADLPVFAMLVKTSLIEGRKLIAEFLVNLECEESVQILDVLAADKEKTVRLAAVTSLAKMKGLPSMLTLFAHKAEPDGRIRKCIYGALASKASANDLIFLLSSLPEDCDSALRRSTESAIRQRVSPLLLVPQTAGI